MPFVERRIIDMDIIKLLEVVFSTDVNALLVNMAKVGVGETTDLIRFHYVINQAIENYLVVQPNANTREQLKEIIKELKKDLKKQINNRDIHLIDDINEKLDEKFQIYEFSDDVRENLKKNFECSILGCIEKIDVNFRNNLKLAMQILEERKNNEQQDMKIEQIERSIQIIQHVIALKAIQSPLKGNSVCPQIDDPNKMVGHIDELKQIEKLYSAGSNVAFLCGRPGMGKTTLAKRYARQANETSEVYFVTYENSIEYTIGKFAKDNLKNGGHKVLNYWRRLKSERPILLIIDNFDENPLQGANKQKIEKELNGEFYNELVNIGIQILITTRIYVERNRVELMPVENQLDLFEKYYERPIEDEIKKTIKEIINVLHGNTLLIILAANNLKTSVDVSKTLDVLYRLKNCNIQGETTEVGIYADIQDIDAKTIYLQAEALLDISGIQNDSTAKEVFANTILLPLDGINKQEFFNLTENTNNNTLKKLIDNSWVLTDSQNIYLHTVVREIAIRKGYVSYELCKNYCKNIKEKISIRVQFEERVAYKNYALEIFKIFKAEKSLDQELLRLFYDLSDIYDELSERVQAMELVEVVKKHIHAFDTKPIEKAKILSGIAYSLNNYYDNMDKLEKNHELLKMALETINALELNQYNKCECAQTKGNILSNFGSNFLAKSKCAQSSEKEYLNQAIDWHKQALKLRQEQYETLLGEQEDTRRIEAAIATSHTTIATDYFYYSDYEQALKQHLKALKIREELHNSKGKSINQQRIIGCVIEIYRQQLFIDEKYISLALSYYPQLLEANHSHKNNNALQDNVRYLVVLKGIVLNDRRLECFIDQIKEKCQQVESFIESHEELKEMLADNIFLADL